VQGERQLRSYAEAWTVDDNTDGAIFRATEILILQSFLRVSKDRDMTAMLMT
jgi:hypothetical protein